MQASNFRYTPIFYGAFFEWDADGNPVTLEVFNYHENKWFPVVETTRNYYADMDLDPDTEYAYRLGEQQLRVRSSGRLETPRDIAPHGDWWKAGDNENV